MAEKRILIVEDDVDNTMLVRVLLEREKYQVLSAQDGELGLNIARETPLDLIVLDLDMPKVDGWEVIEQLKANQQTQHIPIVVVTAHLMNDERSRVFDAGGDSYVQKPFGIHELVEEIRRLI